MDIDYQIEKYWLSATGGPLRLAQEWANSMDEHRQFKTDPDVRLRTDLLNVDYVASFELLFRLQLIRLKR
ncbi:hypothetical protein RY966_004717 [Enterobacter kobei]|nr:hypothetical protein [Enterobacter kobei]